MLPWSYVQCNKHTEFRLSTVLEPIKKNCDYLFLFSGMGGDYKCGITTSWCPIQLVCTTIVGTGECLDPTSAKPLLESTSVVHVLSPVKKLSGTVENCIRLSMRIIGCSKASRVRACSFLSEYTKNYSCWSKLIQIREAIWVGTIPVLYSMSTERPWVRLGSGRIARYGSGFSNIS
jgi:hypothetical protein